MGQESWEIHILLKYRKSPSILQHDLQVPSSNPEKVTRERTLSDTVDNIFEIIKEMYYVYNCFKFVCTCVWNKKNTCIWSLEVDARYLSSLFSILSFFLRLKLELTDLARQ